MDCKINSDNLSKSDCISAYQLFWPAGILSILLIFWPSMPYSETREFAAYIGLGTIFPFVLFFIAKLINTHFIKHKLTFTLISVFYLLFIAILLYRYKQSFNLIILTSILTTILYVLKNLNSHNIKPINIINIFLISTSFWILSSTLIHWDSFGSISKTPYIMILFICVLFIISDIFWAKNRTVDKLKINKFDFLAIISFLLLSFRTDSLFIGDSWVHWGYYTGVIDSVKQGGYLLWDTPSQYGFLSILIPAALPFKNSWQSFFVLQGLLLFVVSVPFYFLARFQFVSRFSGIWSFLIVASALFFSTSNSISPTCIPSGSVIRFFWVYVLLFYFWFNFYLNNKTSKFNEHLGILLWVFGFLWSAESAIYCSAIFIPGYLCRELISQEEDNVLSNFILVSKKFILALFYLGMFILAISLYYLIRLNHLPDIESFYEYIVAYSSRGVGTLPID